MRDTVTSALEVAGMVLLVASAALQVARWVTLPAGLSVAGLGALGVSAAIVRFTPTKPEDSGTA